MRLRKLDVGYRQSRRLPVWEQSSLQPGQEPAQVAQTHYCPGPGYICFAKVVWAKQRITEKKPTPAPRSMQSTFSAWFELSLTFDPRLNLVCNWWLYIESYAQVNHRNPMFSKQLAPRRGRLSTAHVFELEHPAAFASSF